MFLDTIDTKKHFFGQTLYRLILWKFVITIVKKVVYTQIAVLL